MDNSKMYKYYVTYSYQTNNITHAMNRCFVHHPEPISSEDDINGMVELIRKDYNLDDDANIMITFFTLLDSPSIFSQDELEKCPFCKKAPEVIVSDHGIPDNSWAAVMCEGAGCPIKPSIFSDINYLQNRYTDDVEVHRAEAIRRWNGFLRGEL